jgi:hypothetical protein
MISEETQNSKELSGSTVPKSGSSTEPPGEFMEHRFPGFPHELLTGCIMGKACVMDSTVFPEIHKLKS